jgi:hypothetical protein
VRQAKEIDWALAIFEQGLQRGFGAVLRHEIAKERVASAEGKKSEGDASVCSGVGEDAVKDFVSCAVAANRYESSIALIVGFAGEFGGVAGASRGDDVYAEAALAEARDCRACELSGSAAASGWIYDGEKCFSHVGAASHRSQLAEQKLRHCLLRLAPPVRARLRRQAKARPLQRQNCGGAILLR